MQWTHSEAENRIHRYAKHPDFDLEYSRHAKMRIERRGILISDLNHILKYGYIDGEPERTTPSGYYKCKICGKSPHSGSREICLVVVLAGGKPAVKIVTVMWKDLS